jgi:pyrophosphatase PpaX
MESLSPMYYGTPVRPTGPFAAILFDVDGTLIDTAELIADSLEHACRRHLGRAHPRAEYYALIGRPAIVQMEILGGDKAPEMMDTAIEYYFEHMEEERPFPGAIDLLAHFSEQGYRLGLVTSKTRRELAPTMRHIPIDRYVHVVVTSEQTTRPKPHPDPVYLALQTLQIAAERTLFVGDSPYDMQAGRAAGVKTAAATWGPHPITALSQEEPDYVLRDLRDLRTICKPPPHGPST